MAGHDFVPYKPSRYPNVPGGEPNYVTRELGSIQESLKSLAPEHGTTTLTIVATIGALTTASAKMYWTRITSRVWFHITGTITTNGTGAGQIQFSGLPFRPARDASVSGRENGVTGKALTGQNFSAFDLVNCTFYDGTYPGANGAVLEIAGHYEIT